ncbi:UNVERIFIED_CONTAM: hypothetical protein K2H54_035598 [Gekko kuhli]
MPKDFLVLMELSSCSVCKFVRNPKTREIFCFPKASEESRLQVNPMAPVSACRMLLLLLILLGPLPASPQTYQNFQRKHMDYPKTTPHLAPRQYCNQMMQRRRMTNPICKEFNSFIHEPANAVDAICTNGGTHVNGSLYDSHASFNLTNCQDIRGRGQRPPCNYRGWTEQRRIEVACNNQSLPVHFERRI